MRSGPLALHRPGQRGTQFACANSAPLWPAVKPGVKSQTMITQQIAAIALRLLAIWFVIQIVLNLIMVLSIPGQYQQQQIPLMAYIGIMGSFLVVGLVIAFLIDKASESVLARAKTDSALTLSDESQMVLFQLAGLYFIVTALASLPGSLFFIPMSVEIIATNMLWPAGSLFQLVVGFWLVANSVFWLDLFNRLRGHT